MAHRPSVSSTKSVTNRPGSRTHVISNVKTAAAGGEGTATSEAKTADKKTDTSKGSKGAETAKAHASDTAKERASSHSILNRSSSQSGSDRSEGKGVVSGKIQAKLKGKKNIGSY